MGIRCADHVTPLYPQKLALTSPTGGGCSVSIVRSRTKAMEFFMEHLIFLNSTALDTTGLSTYMLGCFIGLFDKIYHLHRPYSIITSNKSVTMRMEVLMVYFKELISIFCRRFKKIIKNVSQESCCPDGDFSLALFNTKQDC